MRYDWKIMKFLEFAEFYPKECIRKGAQEKKVPMDILKPFCRDISEYIVFRAKDNIADPYFLYYLVCSQKVRKQAIKSMVGFSGRQRVQTDVVKKIEILLPSLDEQKKLQIY